ncbi:hypothetical protein Tco_0121814 [Tanacetum coccineum]
MSDLYDVKFSVRSSVKLLPEIKGFLSMKPNRENLFRDTVFGPWLDIQSHENDSHMMHYVFSHQVSVPNLRPDCPPIIFHIGDHWLEFGRKEFCLITGFRFAYFSEKHGAMSTFFDRYFSENKTRKGFKKINGFDLLNVLKDKQTLVNMLDEDAVRLCLLIASELMWEKFYNRTVNVVSRHTEHHLAQLKKNPNFNATYNLYGFAWAFKMSHAWFKDSAEFIKGLDAQDGTFLQDDQCREKSIEQHNGMCGDTEDGTFVHRVVGKICPKMNRMSVDDGDGVFDSQSDDGDGVLDSQTKDVIEEASMLPTMSSNSPQAWIGSSMAALRYRDEHNKVGYVQKPKGSDDYHQILDFLGASHIRSPLAILATIDETLHPSRGIHKKGKVNLFKNKFFHLNGGFGPHHSSLSQVPNLVVGINCHLSTPPRQQATPSVAPVFEHGQRTDSNIASSSRVHETEDDSLGGSFHETPPRFTQASPTGHTSGGAEDHITLSALSSIVSTLVQKVSYLETELKAHKKLFKDVVAKLVKKVKALEVKLKTKKRKVVLSDSDQEEGGEQAVDLDALIALANAAVTVDSTKSPAGASSNPTACSYDPNSDVPTTAIPTDVLSGVDPTGPSTVSPGSTTVPTSSSILLLNQFLLGVVLHLLLLHHLSEMSEKEKVLLLKNILQLEIILLSN